MNEPLNFSSLTPVRTRRLKSSASLICRYETLAVATDAESRQDPDLPLKTGGKRLTVNPPHTP